MPFVGVTLVVMAQAFTRPPSRPRIRRLAAGAFAYAGVVISTMSTAPQPVAAALPAAQPRRTLIAPSWQPPASPPGDSEQHGPALPDKYQRITYPQCDPDPATGMVADHRLDGKVSPDACNFVEYMNERGWAKVDIGCFQPGGPDTEHGSGLACDVFINYQDPAQVDKLGEEMRFLSRGMLDRLNIERIYYRHEILDGQNNGAPRWDTSAIGNKQPKPFDLNSVAGGENVTLWHMDHAHVKFREPAK